MSRRIDIELTSVLGDGTWTWRAAGAKQPKGILDGSLLPSDAAVGDEYRVEAEQELDGITILSIVPGREKQSRALVELLPVEKDFKPVLETRAGGGRGGREGGRDGGRGRRDDRGDRGDRRPRGDGPRADRDRPAGERGPRPDGNRGDAPRGDGRRTEGQRRDSAGGGRRPGGERRGPSFTPPPELPQRPKPKRLRPGKTNRAALLADIPEAQRQIAELALQGMGAVRQRVREENDRAAAEGRPPMPEASVVKLAEDLLPKLRVAEWLDRAEAAQRQMEHLDLRDLRSVVVSASDPMVERDESTRTLAAEMRAALISKQEQELVLWFGDVDAALAVGRVIRALRLSSQPPKAGVPFPVDIAQRLIDSVNASLAPMDAPDRWAAMLEAAAFSPIREKIAPTRKPDVVNDELLATVKRLAPALPQIAAMFDVEVDPKAPMPKPLRAGPPRKGPEGDKPARGSCREGGRDGGGRDGGGRDGGGREAAGKGKGPGRYRRDKTPVPERDPAVAESTELDTPVVAPDSVENPSADTTAADSAAVDTPTADTPTADTEAVETPIAGTFVVNNEAAAGEASDPSDGDTGGAATPGGPVDDPVDNPEGDNPEADNVPAATETEAADAPVSDSPAADSGANGPATDTSANETEAVRNEAADNPSHGGPAGDTPAAVDIPAADVPATDAPFGADTAVTDAPVRDATAVDTDAADEPATEETSTDTSATETEDVPTEPADIPSNGAPVTDTPTDATADTIDTV